MENYDILINKVKEYSPDLIFISCGFDALHTEELADFPLKPNDYRILTDKIKKINLTTKIVSSLEGGYDLNSLKDCINYHLDGLIS